MKSNQSPHSWFFSQMSVLGAFAVALLLTPKAATADVRLPRLFSDHMVLQRDMPVRVFGWAEPDEEIAVTLNGQSKSTRTDSQRNWEVILPPMKAGGPHSLKVAGRNTVAVEDVLIGEVWVCSGQSNMELGLVVTHNHDKETAAAIYPKIRLFTVGKKMTTDSPPDIQAEWRLCSPATVSYFSAVAYYFGRELHKELDVPVGLIASTENGTRIEPWTPAQGIKSVPELADIDKPVDGEIYNRMVRGLTHFNIRGVIWYQGEGNVGDGPLYLHRMRALILGWREAWGQPELPFYYVQLAPLNWGGKPLDQLPLIWEAQTAALSIPNTGMVVTNDIGNTGDAHPRNKRDVGRRLAAWALVKTFGRSNLAYCGPLYSSMEIKANKAVIEFNYASSGLKSRDGKPLNWFIIAGPDKKFVPAQAEIDGSRVVVWSDEIRDPVAVRFGWLQTAEPNLVNKEGLPASSFRTDRW